MNYQEIIEKLESLENLKNVEGMARFGIKPKARVLGISIPVIRKMGKDIGKNHNLALKLFDSEIHEAQILAGYIADSEKFTKKQIEKWVRAFDSWDVVDQVCLAVIWEVKFAVKIIFEYSKRKEEFVKRTAFTLMCCLAVHDKKMKDAEFEKFFPLIIKASTDERNFVKKAVNWALRQIGKRNKNLNKKALKVAKEILKIDNKVAKWIAKDAICELESSAVQKRLK